MGSQNSNPNNSRTIVKKINGAGQQKGEEWTGCFIHCLLLWAAGKGPSRNMSYQVLK